MAEMIPATSFAFSPKGPYSLAASIRYLEGFAPAAYDSESAANLEMAFCVDGFWAPVAVRIHEETGAVHGTIHGGAHDLSQTDAMRPVPGWAQHRMPIPGLYQTGGTTHPGGSITGAPGRNAAIVMLQDLGRSLNEVIGTAQKGNG